MICVCVDLFLSRFIKLYRVGVVVEDLSPCKEYFSNKSKVQCVDSSLFMTTSFDTFPTREDP